MTLITKDLSTSPRNHTPTYVNAESGANRLILYLGYNNSTRAAPKEQELSAHIQKTNQVTPEGGILAGVVLLGGEPRERGRVRKRKHGAGQHRVGYVHIDMLQGVLPFLQTSQHRCLPYNRGVLTCINSRHLLP